VPPCGSDVRGASTRECWTSGFRARCPQGRAAVLPVVLDESTSHEHHTVSRSTTGLGRRLCLCNMLAAAAEHCRSLTVRQSVVMPCYRCSKMRFPSNIDHDGSDNLVQLLPSTSRIFQFSSCPCSTLSLQPRRFLGMLLSPATPIDDKFESSIFDSDVSALTVPLQRTTCIRFSLFPLRTFSGFERTFLAAQPRKPLSRRPSTLRLTI
jgi:hypothetical protein